MRLLILLLIISHGLTAQILRKTDDGYEFIDERGVPERTMKTQDNGDIVIEEVDVNRVRQNSTEYIKLPNGDYREQRLDRYRNVQPRRERKTPVGVLPEDNPYVITD